MGGDGHDSCWDFGEKSLWETHLVETTHHLQPYATSRGRVVHIRYLAHKNHCGPKYNAVEGISSGWIAEGRKGKQEERSQVGMRGSRRGIAIRDSFIEAMATHRHEENTTILSPGQNHATAIR